MENDETIGWLRSQTMIRGLGSLTDTCSDFRRPSVVSIPIHTHCTLKALKRALLIVPAIVGG